MEIRNKKILVLAPHTDDGEFGCGATINKLVKNGNEVFYAAFSACEQSVLKDFPKDILISEVKKATVLLGIKPENIFLFKYEVRTFNFHRQQILEDLLFLKSRVMPDIVFMPTLSDLHQDHSTIANEGIRAFKFTSILCYELPWNNMNFSNTAFFILDEEDVAMKVKAIKQYVSQAHRNYANEEFVRSLARVRGTQINTQWAESFEILRWKF